MGRSTRVAGLVALFGFVGILTAPAASAQQTLLTTRNWPYSSGSPKTRQVNVTGKDQQICTRLNPTVNLVGHNVGIYIISTGVIDVRFGSQGVPNGIQVGYIDQVTPNAGTHDVLVCYGP